MTFDAVFGALAPSILGLFTSELARITRTVDNRDDATGALSISTTFADVKSSPPQPVNTTLLGLDGIVATDLVTYIAAADLAAASFDYSPSTGATFTMQYRGREYGVVTLRVYPGGDSDALIEVVLRS